MSARLVFAAAHVVLLPDYRRLGHSLVRPGPPAEIAAAIDWESTMALRRWLDTNGFGIAEAMDTAQRFHLGWHGARELIERTAALGLPHGFVAGAGTDHLPAVRTATDLIDGVVAQARFIQQRGGIPMLLPMPWLSIHQHPAAEYLRVYGEIVRQLDGPLFLHWLGPMFLPALQGYFPGDSFERLLASAPDKLRGCKLSLLDDAFELRLRRQLLPRDQIVLTGDDFHFGRLLLGGNPQGAPPTTAPAIERHTTIGPHRVALGDFSHGLLGIFDGIAGPAGRALQALARGDVAAFLALMTPCERLGQHVFAAPTQHYKAGLAFLNWLAGRQDNPFLINREDRARDHAHYQHCVELALAADALTDSPALRARCAAFLDHRLAGEPS